MFSMSGVLFIIRSGCSLCPVASPSYKLGYSNDGASLFSAAVNTSTSLVLSSLLSVLVFAGMQMFSKQLGSTEWLTILGGFLGSVLFICSLTVSFVWYQDLNWFSSCYWPLLMNQQFVFMCIFCSIWLYAYLPLYINVQYLQTSVPP